MGYATVNDMRRLLPENITIGDTNIGTPSPGRPASRNDASVSEAEYYISYAGEYIDSRLRPFYQCPLRRIKVFETELTSSVARGQDATAQIYDTGPFTIGEMVRLQTNDSMETAEVKEVQDLHTLVLRDVNYDYSTGDKISLIQFPDPVRLIAARLAVSFLLDALFVAEQSPDVSTYGKTQRNIARNALDDILSGEILLFGQEHTGRRFVRGSLLDAYKSPAEVQKGEERE